MGNRRRGRSIRIELETRRKQRMVTERDPHPSSEDAP